MGEPSDRLGVLAQGIPVKAADGMEQSDRNSAGGNIAGGRAVVRQRDDEVERRIRPLKGRAGIGGQPPAGVTVGQVEQARADRGDRVRGEFPPVRGQRFDDRQRELGLIGDLPGGDLGAVRKDTQVVAIDRTKALGDTGSVPSRHRHTQRIPNGHAEESAQKAVLSGAVR